MRTSFKEIITGYKLRSDLNSQIGKYFSLLLTAVSFMACARSCVIWTQLTFLTTLLTSYFSPLARGSQVGTPKPPALILLGLHFLEMPLHAPLFLIKSLSITIWCSCHPTRNHFITPSSQSPLLHQTRCGMLSKCSDGITLQKCTLFAIYATLILEFKFLEGRGFDLSRLWWQCYFIVVLSHPGPRNNYMAQNIKVFT